MLNNRITDVTVKDILIILFTMTFLGILVYGVVSNTNQISIKDASDKILEGASTLKQLEKTLGEGADNFISPN